jgi:hypothetical protein
MSNKKLQYDVVLTTGKSARTLERNKKKKLKKGVLESPLGKMRSRQERKEMAKSLGIPFTPRYNGLRFKLEHTLVKAYEDREYTRVKSMMVEVK